MSDITKKEIEGLSALARITLAKGEEEELAQDLKHILAYVGTLEEADTGSVSELFNVTGTTNQMRGDEGGETVGPREGLVDAAPKKKNAYVKVKPIWKK